MWVISASPFVLDICRGFGGESPALESSTGRGDCLRISAPLQEVLNDWFIASLYQIVKEFPATGSAFRMGRCPWQEAAGALFCPMGTAGHCGRFQGHAGVRRLRIRDQAHYNARGDEDRPWGGLSDTKAKYSGLGVRESSSTWSVSPEEPCVLWAQTLSAPKAVASLLLPRYHCVISHFCHISETANETAKAGP